MDEETTRRGFFKHGMRGLFAAGLGVGFYNTTSYGVQLQEVTIRIRDLPRRFSGFTIGLLSDTHASMIANNGLFEEAARLIMSKRPQMITLTGDYISGSTKFLSSSIGKFRQDYLDQLVDSFSALKAPMGIYAVLGNHDFWSGPKALESISDGFSRKLGVTWLRNRNLRLEKEGEAINLLGVDDYWQNSCSLHRAYQGLNHDSVNIMLSHNPDINDDVLPQMRIDLILSGHTHGGQIYLPVIGCPVVPSKFGQKYIAGLVRDGERQTYITRGVGHLMAPIRINCPPEATIITLEKAA
ncbi:MAG: metallophosphoesterase [Nitrospinota bacterium]|nr:metallophosphoesterase [Nitrospinota bacterium]MDH5677287.1 metallophosphoesterase [Nitrospinota bacterium]MDH5756222.1 metallophosphoesterase [Nitrospinota bacterium]